MIRLGEKIKLLRKQKNISQEVFANYLGVSFQAVSKWENGNTMPDVTMIPAIASFFGVSTDELFDFNLYEVEKNVEAIVSEYSKYWCSGKDMHKCEQILRDGLKKYPGNDVLLDCLTDVLCELGRNDEVIMIGKSLVESTKHDDLRFDAYRSMAEAYKAKGEYELAKDAIEHIPEIYFTKLGVAAQLLDGDDSYEAAQKHKMICADDLIDMLIITGKRLRERGELEKANSQFRIALGVIDAFKEDFIEKRWYRDTVYGCASEQRREIEKLLAE